MLAPQLLDSTFTLAHGVSLASEARGHIQVELPVLPCCEQDRCQCSVNWAAPLLLPAWARLAGTACPGTAASEQLPVAKQ